jgi:hypothetical protein
MNLPFCGPNAPARIPGGSGSMKFARLHTSGNVLQIRLASQGKAAIGACMNAASLFGSLLALALTCSFATADEAAAAPKALFNGKDLTGWKAFLTDDQAKMEDVWSVKDGILVCKGQPMGYLHTTDSFTDGRFVVEWRWAPGTKPGNSGVLLRVTPAPRLLPRCLEAQLKSGNAGDLYGFQGMPLAGPAARMRSGEGEVTGKLAGLSREGGKEVEPGEWNRMEIILKQGEITVMLNGEKVNHGTGCEVVAGPIALQSEGGEIHFRTVTVSPL